MTKQPKRTHGQIWHHLSTRMKDRWHANRHEDTVTIGVPDISFGINGKNGWIEMKSLPDWPKTSRPLKLHDLTIHQVKWIEKRLEFGGDCWILISVGRDFVLIPGKFVRSLYKEGFHPLATASVNGYRFIGSIDVPRFADALTRGW